MDHRYAAKLTPRWYQDTNNKELTVEIVREDDCFEEIQEELSKEAFDLINDDGCVVLPAVFKVCPTCRGSGKHVNPDIDSHGITAEEWDRDWSFEDREAYFSGTYDVDCYECKGLRVVPEIDERYLSGPAKEIVSFIHKRVREDVEYARECQREYEMGY